MTLDKAAARAALAIAEAGPGTQWLLATDTDADGLASGAIMATALRRLGHVVTVRASRDKTLEGLLAAIGGRHDGIMFLDKATGHALSLARQAAEAGRHLVIVDHHALPADPLPDTVLLVNPRNEGLDGGKDACSSTTALAVALELNPANVDLAATALVGAIGDWQHVGGWQGWNHECLKRGIEAGSVQRRPGLHLAGGPLRRALELGTAGHVLSQAGIDDPGSWLAELGIDPMATVDALADDEHQRLADALVATAIAANVPAKQLAKLTGDTLMHARLALPLRQVFALADACGRQGQTGLGIALLMGDRTALEGAQRCLQAYQEAIHGGLQQLQQTIRREANLQWGRIDNPAYTGMVAGLGMEHALADDAVPAVVAAPRADGSLQVSTRGTQDLVAQGLDLATAVQDAAATAGGEGGGHPMAAGATLPADGLPTFLAALADGLKTQPWTRGSGDRQTHDS